MRLGDAAGEPRPHRDGSEREQARTSVRLSLGPGSTAEEVDQAVDALVRHVTRIGSGAAAA